MSEKGALDPNEVPMLGGIPKRYPCKLVPFCSCWPPLPYYHSSVLADNYPYFEGLYLCVRPWSGADLGVI